MIGISICCFLTATRSQPSALFKLFVGALKQPPKSSARSFPSGFPCCMARINVSPTPPRPCVDESNLVLHSKTDSFDSSEPRKSLSHFIQDDLLS